MRKGILAALAAVSTLLVPISAWADDTSPSSTHLTLDAGLAFGGDKLATVYYTNGNSKTLRAGDAIYGAVGFEHDFGVNWGFKSSLGYSFTSAVATNGDTTFDRFPLDLLAVYNSGRHKFGFGATYHMSPHLDGNGFFPNVDFDNALGWVLQYQYAMIGVRYTNISYHVSGPCAGTCSFSGESLGVFFNWTFGR